MRTLIGRSLQATILAVVFGGLVLNVAGFRDTVANQLANDVKGAVIQPTPSPSP